MKALDSHWRWLRHKQVHIKLQLYRWQKKLPPLDRRYVPLIFLGGLVLTTTGFYLYLAWGLPDVRQIQKLQPDGSLRMIARDGTLIYSEGTAPRQIVSKLPTILKQAAVASEDRRFYKHNGTDLWGISRAFVSNLRQGELAEGGSTITQQLARVLFLNQDKTIGRKLQEILLAFKLEGTYTKDEILTFYLNYCYFGGGAYGVADASRLYFNKSVGKLTPAEAALLIGVLPAPSVYSPLKNRDLARKRRDIVLERMAREGVINAATATTLRQQTPRYRFQSTDFKTHAYFSSYVTSLLPSLIDPERLAQGGLVIETTLDPKAQGLAQRTLTRQVRSFKGVKQGALVSLDPANGEIRALVGGVNYAQSQFNRATQAKRQPGSAFKPFVYLTGIEQGYLPDRVYVDRPFYVGNYTPQNADGEYWGEISLAEALAQSRNTVAVQLLMDLGTTQVIETARRLGISTPLRPEPSLALGASEVHLLELTSAYGVLANQGIRVVPQAVRKIRDRQGQILYQSPTAGKQVVHPETAWAMTELLRYAVTEGTGQATEVDFPAAGKTGTTDRGRDLVFVGYTPKLVTGVWLGNDDDVPTQQSSRLAAQVWGAYMRQVVGKSSPDFAEPPGLRPEIRALVRASTGYVTESELEEESMPWYEGIVPWGADPDEDPD